MKCLKCGNDINEETGLCPECDSAEESGLPQKKNIFSDMTNVTKVMMALIVCLVLGLGALTYLFFDMRKDFNDVSSQLGVAKASIEENISNIDKLNNELSHKDSEIRSLNDTIDGLNSNVNELDSGIKDLSEDINRGSDRIDSIEELLDDTGNRIAGSYSELSQRLSDVSTSLSDTTTAYTNAYLKACDSIVRITNQDHDYRVLGGSGVIATSDGYIFTCYHVVKGYRRIDIYMQDGREFTAKLVAGDDDRDIAVLKIKEEVSDLPAASFCSLDDILPGDLALALGYPAVNFLKGPLTVTAGIVSCVREFEGCTWVQFDTTMNPGNSGGAIINQKGEVMGFGSFELVGYSREYENLCFAVPADTGWEYLNEYLESQS